MNFELRQIQSCKFSLLLSDQMLFRSSDVSIKCRLIKCRLINCQVTKKYTDRNENNSKTLQFTDCCTLQYTGTIENNSNRLHITVYKQNSVNCLKSLIYQIVVYEK